jgi:D-alanine-D-alanine ligase
VKITILYNRISDTPLPDEWDVLEQVRSVSQALAEQGHSVTELPFDLNLESAKTALLEHAPDLVFNLVESVDGKGSLLHFAPALLETLRIPYTGCPLDAVYVTSNKVLAKTILAAAQLDTPEWTVPPDDTGRYDSDSACGRWIVKSVWEHASLGMDHSAVIGVRQNCDIAEAVDLRRRRYGGEWFAERFIDGREFNMALLAGPDGVEVLHPAEIVFNNFVSGKPRIVDYRAKWEPDSFEYRNTVRSFSFSDPDASLLAKLNTLSLACWRIFHLRGYARVDFRVDAAGKPWILEINANPCLSEDAGFAAAVKKTGYTYSTAIRRILEDSVCPAGTKTGADRKVS